MLLTFAPAYAQNAAAVLKQLDKSASDFKSVIADLKRTEYTKAIDDKMAESGKLSLLKIKKDDLRILFEISVPSVSTALFSGSTLEIFKPKLNMVEVYNLGKNKDLVRQVLQLGFGVSGTDLSKNYIVSYAGEEIIGGQKTSKLELVPKSAEAKKNVSKVEMNFSDKGYSLRTKVIEPNGNYHLAEYSNIKWNAPVTDADIGLKAPKTAERKKMG
jgi:outer membrane lipoprotein-sorting protein